MNEYENYIIERMALVKEIQMTNAWSLVSMSLSEIIMAAINTCDVNNQSVICIAIKIGILENEKYFCKPIHFICLQMKRYRLKYVLRHPMTIDLHLHSTIFKD